MDFRRIVDELERGICPKELCYNKIEAEEIDWEKVAYNTRFHTEHFYADKFPSALHQLPGFGKIIEDIVEKNADNSPLKEIEERQRAASLAIQQTSDSEQSDDGSYSTREDDTV